jgi:hypothetical protein
MIYPIMGSVLAVIVGLFLKKVSDLKFVTEKTFRDFQVKNRELHDEHFVVKAEFDKFKVECYECHKMFPEKYATCAELRRQTDRLENIHRNDMAELYRTVKGGLESITTRIDNLSKLRYEKE